MNHPVLSHRRRLLAYTAMWLPVSVLFGTLLGRTSGLRWLDAQVLAVPLALVYGFVCLAAWYPCRATPLRGGSAWLVATKIGLAASLSSAVWLLLAGAWTSLLGRLGAGRGVFAELVALVPSIFVIGVLLYLLAAAGSYLAIAIDESRVAEVRALEAQQRQAVADRELELARELQRRLLPPAEYRSAQVRLAARNMAARTVAGDFYDYFALPDGSLAVAVADVSGKGVAASLITATVKAVLPLIAADGSVTGTLAALNRRLIAQLGPREFVALALMRLEPSSGMCEIANAGLPDPYLLRAGRPAAPLEVPQPRLPLGVWRDLEYRSVEARLEPGDRVLLITDGLPEAPTTTGEPFGYGGLAELLVYEARDAGVWLDELLGRLRATTSPELEDDWTAVVVERCAEEGG